MEKQTKAKQALDNRERIERQRLKAKQKREREKLSENQTARRKKALKPTKAGGRREGAGRKPIAHKPLIVAGQDLNEKRTFTVYGAQDEVKPTRHFLQVWRLLRFNTPDLWLKLAKVKGDTMYKLLTGAGIEEAEKKKLAKVLPEVLALHETYRAKFEKQSENQK
jgi:hypothetical protein